MPPRGCEEVLASAYFEAGKGERRFEHRTVEDAAMR
jgi:hypothetical protein